MSQQLVTWIIARADKCCRIAENGPYSQQSPATRIDAGASGCFPEPPANLEKKLAGKSRPLPAGALTSRKSPGAGRPGRYKPRGRGGCGRRARAEAQTAATREHPALGGPSSTALTDPRTPK
ncbi:hypothetical protein J1605_007830 [Eschrichtius robustus]|uniref:Uncharacterized protein n=1 Tax=Eschrichtius robustus TaxID=9764 RepID=A0AB34GXF7_ESCRO|nr:hypothetical protein J1605_011374 [Eschrichtius robustus]KAJ8784803.1 hypothetical protein J1605_007830 [Eschrichtius robustus]